MSQVIQNTPTPQMLTTLLDTPNGNQNNHREGQDKEVVMSASMFLPAIKQEPTVIEMDDTHNYLSEENPNSYTFNSKIRVTPTSKLLATPNPVDPKRKFKCPYENCTKSYGKSSHLRSHLTWHTGIKPFVCSEPMCGKGFTRSDELNRHVRTHTGEKPFECIQCTKKFSRSDHLTKHLATHERQLKSATKRHARNTAGTFVVKKSNKLAETDSMQERHCDLSRELESHSCMDHNNGIHFMTTINGGSNTDNNNIRQNDTLSHLKPNIQSEKVFDHISLPEQQAANRIKIESHSINNNYDSHPTIPKLTELYTSTEVKNEPGVGVVSLPPTDGPYTYGMPQFIEESHERPFSCQVANCLKRFKRQDDLNRHIRTHTGEKPYACFQCERRFVRSDHLKKHQQTHNKNR